MTDAHKTMKLEANVGDFVWSAHRTRAIITGATYNQGALKKAWKKNGTNPFVIAMVREPNNKFDKDAIAYVSDYGVIGHVPTEDLYMWNAALQEAGDKRTCFVGTATLHSDGAAVPTIYASVMIHCPK
jgi:hypothetical protein